MGKKEEENRRIVPTVWSRFNKLESQITELNESLNEVAQNRIGWEEKIEGNYRELLEKYSECEDSTIHKRFFKGLLEKLDSKQTENKDCEKKHYCNQCSEFINNSSRGGKAYCKKGFNCFEHAKTLRNLYTYKKDSEGEKDVSEVDETGGATPTRNVELDTSSLLSDDSKPSESEKEFEFQLVEKFIPPRSIKCTDCMNNPVPELIEKFLREIVELYFSLGDDKIENFKFTSLKQEYEGMLEE